MPEPFTMQDLPALRTALRTYNHDAYALFFGRLLALPDWFHRTLDPMSSAYREQQMRLWRSISEHGLDYDPERDEQFDDRDGSDVIASPGFYRPRGGGALDAAGNHLIAMGQILKASGLVAGNTAIEYGAGYGQIAVALARLGVEVDTVDINQHYNDAVQRQAEVFGIPLRSHQGVFGFSPRGMGAYDLVLFYEAFHHCADFDRLPQTLRAMLKPGGKVLMAGEPAVNGDPAIPYPWGVRLDHEAVAVTAARGWLELGFTEDFLVSLFLRSGFTWRRHDCHLTFYGVVHEFTPRRDEVAMSEYRMPGEYDVTWHPVEPDGRWTRHVSHLPVHDLGFTGHVVLRLRNHDHKAVPVRLDGKSGGVTVDVEPGQTAEIGIPASDVGPYLRISSPTFQPPGDGRNLGIFVLGFDYRP